MQQIADWLEEIGMSEYAERFAANDIDTTVLGHLTDQDLKDLGVSLGHRRKMLAAIAGYRAILLSPPPDPKPQDAAERRQVTVMFSDLVGSTALSAHFACDDCPLDTRCHEIWVSVSGRIIRLACGQSHHISIRAPSSSSMNCRERRPGKSIDRFFARGARGGLGAQGTAAWHDHSPLNPDVIGPEFSQSFSTRF